MLPGSGGAGSGGYVGGGSDFGAGFAGVAWGFGFFFACWGAAWIGFGQAFGAAMAAMFQAFTLSILLWVWFALYLAFCALLMFYFGILGGTALAIGGGFALWHYHARK